MFEDSWYSFVPDYQQQQRQAQSSGHQRKKSLLQPPNVSGLGSQELYTQEMLLTDKLHMYRV